jgi:hypothetical protein
MDPRGRCSTSDEAGIWHGDVHPDGLKSEHGEEHHTAMKKMNSRPHHRPKTMALALTAFDQQMCAEAVSWIQ